MDLNQNEGLNRAMGATDVAVNTFNNVVGAGIFLLPALVAVSIGDAAILAYVVCGIMVYVVMLCFAEVSSRVTTTGGAYAYVEKAFGPFAGFITNSLYWFGLGIIADAAVANGMADILGTFIPSFAIPIYRGIFFFLFFGGLAFLNVRGVKQGMYAVWTGTLLKILPLILLIAVGLSGVTMRNLYWHKWPSVHNLGEASLILFFAFMGADVGLIGSGEMKNPKRTAPLGMLWGLSLVVIFYVLIQCVAQGVLGADLKNHVDAPLATVAKVIIGPWGATLLSVGAIVSIISSLCTSPVLISRLIFAASNDRLLPGFLARIHPRFATPHYAIIVYCCLDFVFSISGGFKDLVILTSAATLLIYLGVVSATIKLKLAKNAETEGIFKLPFGITIPIIAIGIIIWLLAHLSKREIIALTIFAAIAASIYLASMLIQKKVTEGKVAPEKMS